MTTWGFARIAAMLVLLLGCSEAPINRDISPEDLLRQVGKKDAPLVIDVRTPDEYASGHVPGAINIPHDQIAGRLAELKTERERTIVTYCMAGRRADMAADELRAAGFSVQHLKGDMAGWYEAGRPVEK